MHLISRAGDDAAGPAPLDAFQPQENDLPGTVAVDAVVTRNAEVAVLLHTLRLHGNGVVIQMGLRRRTDPEPEDDGFDRFGMLTERVLVGVETAAGVRAVSVGYPPYGSEGAPAGTVLHHQGGGGGGRTYEMGYWFSPVPPPGDLVVHAASVPLGLPEGSVVVPAAAIAEATARREVLWAREPDRQHGVTRLPPPEVPPGGWFARVVGHGGESTTPST